MEKIGEAMAAAKRLNEHHTNHHSHSPTHNSTLGVPGPGSPSHHGHNLNSMLSTPEGGPLLTPRLAAPTAAAAQGAEIPTDDPNLTTPRPSS